MPHHCCVLLTPTPRPRPRPRPRPCPAQPPPSGQHCVPRAPHDAAACRCNCAVCKEHRGQLCECRERPGGVCHDLCLCRCRHCAGGGEGPPAVTGVQMQCNCARHVDDRILRALEDGQLERFAGTREVPPWGLAHLITGRWEEEETDRFQCAMKEWGDSVANTKTRKRQMVDHVSLAVGTRNRAQVLHEINKHLPPQGATDAAGQPVEEGGGGAAAAVGTN